MHYQLKPIHALESSAQRRRIPRTAVSVCAIVLMLLVVAQHAAAQCVPPISQRSFSFSNAFHKSSFTASDPNKCGWEVTKSAEWIVLTGRRSGKGSLSVPFNVLANPGTASRAAVLQAGNTFVTILQQGATRSCNVSLAPPNIRTSDSFGKLHVQVSSEKGCAWQVRNPTPWIIITSGHSGTGKGTITFNVLANPGNKPRAGFLHVNNRALRVLQDGAETTACSITVTPPDRTVAAGGGEIIFDVAATTSNCAWSANGFQNWITPVGPGSGSGSATLRLRVSPNSSAASRSTDIHVSGKVIRVTQLGVGCEAVVAPLALSAPAAGGDLTTHVDVAPACPWRAESRAEWISLPQGTAYIGSRAITLRVRENTSASPRSGVVVVAGKQVSVTQSSRTDECAEFEVTPTSHRVGSNGGSMPVSVRTSASCRWSAASQASWISLSGGLQYLGSEVITLNIRSNDGEARQGTVMVHNRSVSIAQDARIDGPIDSDCAFSVTPDAVTVTSRGADRTFSIAPPQWCASESWRLVSSQQWVSLIGPTEGAGSGVFNLRVHPNLSGERRTANITAIEGDGTYLLNGNLQITQNGEIVTPTVYRPGEGAFYVLSDDRVCPKGSKLEYHVGSLALCTSTVQRSGGIAVRGDVDGDTILDHGTWEPSDGVWRVAISSNACPSTFTQTSVSPSHLICVQQWGLPGDEPILGADIDADGRSDPIVWRPSSGVWYVIPSTGLCPAHISSGLSTAQGQPACFAQFGLPGDFPIHADFDRDGRSDMAVWRPPTGEWFLRTSSSAMPPYITGRGATADGYSYGTRQFGLRGDVPFALPMDADGHADLLVWRRAEGNWFVLPSDGIVPAPFETVGRLADGRLYGMRQWGLPTDEPRAGDFDGDGRGDIVVWRPSEGNWYMPMGHESNPCPDTVPLMRLSVCLRQFGLSTDWPVR